MEEEIENIIKKNLPKKQETEMCENPCDSCLKGDGFNQALSQINTSLIADEVLKVVVEKIRESIKVAQNNYMEKVMQNKFPSIIETIEDALLSNLSPNKENKNNG